jgi:hypothetical protein
MSHKAKKVSFFWKRGFLAALIEVWVLHRKC